MQRDIETERLRQKIEKEGARALRGRDRERQ